MPRESIRNDTPIFNLVAKSASILEQQKVYEAIMYTYKNLIPELKDTAKKVAEVRNKPRYSKLVKVTSAEIVTTIVEARLRDINQVNPSSKTNEIYYTEKALLFALAKISYKLGNFTKTIECLNKIGIYIIDDFRILRLAAHKALSNQLKAQEAQDDFEREFRDMTADFTDATTD